MTAPIESGKPKAPPRQSFGGGRAFIGLLLITIASLLWWRSYRHGDVIAFFGPSGQISGILSTRGQLFLAFTNIDTGSYRAWTIQTTASSLEEGTTLRDMLIGDTPANTLSSVMGNGASAPTTTPPLVSKKWGFLVGRHTNDAFGIPGKWCSVIAAPHWVFLPLGAWPVIGWCVRRSRVWRRSRRGCCLTCGYDLRGIAGRCPECGTVVNPETAPPTQRQPAAGA